MQEHEITLAIRTPTIDRDDAKTVAELIRDRVMSLLDTPVKLVSVNRVTTAGQVPAVIEANTRNWADKPTVIIEISMGSFHDFQIVGYKKPPNPRVVVRDLDVREETIVKG